mgnify:FL=1
MDIAPTFHTFNNLPNGSLFIPFLPRIIRYDRTTTLCVRFSSGFAVLEQNNRRHEEVLWKLLAFRKFDVLTNCGVEHSIHVLILVPTLYLEGVHHGSQVYIFRIIVNLKFKAVRCQVDLMVEDERAIGVRRKLSKRHLPKHYNLIMPCKISMGLVGLSRISPVVHNLR